MPFSPTRILSTAKLASKSDVARTVAGLLVTSAFLIPFAFQQSAAQADHEKATAALSRSTGFHHEQLSVYPKVVKERVDTEAAAALASAQNALPQVTGKTDVTALNAGIASLETYNRLDVDTVRTRTASLTGTVQAATAAAAEFDRAAAEKAAADLAAANTPDGARATARAMAASQYGWGDDQFQCLDSLWSKESGWRMDASNASSGAAGIPQALPGSKMASVGDDWQTNASTQIAWGLGYIASGYGTPCSAWSHSQSSNWY